MATAGWTMAAPEAEPVEWLPVLDLPEPGPQRRLTVLLRLLLLIPQFVVLWVLAVVAFFVAVAGWFAALFIGRLPGGIARYLCGYVGYDTRVVSSVALLIDRYPPFSLIAPADYPVQVGLRPGPLNRLAVFFRIILMFPAAVIQSVAATGWYVAAFVIWLVVLIAGRMPRPLFEATAAIVRYRMRFTAYALMVTSAYPKRLFGDEAGSKGATGSATRPLVLSGAGRGLLVVFLVLGVAADLTGSLTTGTGTDSNSDNPVTQTAPARHSGLRE